MTQENTQQNDPVWQIVAKTDKLVNLGLMHLHVGHSLADWARAESLLCEFYVSLVVSSDHPADGAITTITSVQDISAKIKIIQSCIDQYLFPISFDATKTSLTAKLNRFKTLSQKRNKIAHGAVMEIDRENRFIPFYNGNVLMRERILRAKGTFESRVRVLEKWDLARLAEECVALGEAWDIALDMLKELDKFYQENRAELEDIPSLALELGRPIPRFALNEREASEEFGLGKTLRTQS